ncbi:hypothetical protein COBT_000122 [Conglomerata obtusa]
MRSPSKKILGLIIANEFCERFCYYGFRTLLFVFLREVYFLSENKSTEIVHFFNFSCYFFTIIGGMLSDSIIGRYKTILYLSCIYLIGTILTTSSAYQINLKLLFIGLLLISIGTGGIKPCVSTFGGDQFESNDKKGVERFFNVFYFAINSGSLISIFLTPMLAQVSCNSQGNCYPMAFGIPALLLAISLLLFALGSNKYVQTDPNPKFLAKLMHTLYLTLFFNIIKSNTLQKIKQKFLLTKINPKNYNYEVKKLLIFEMITDKYGIEFVQDIKSAIKILKTFALVPFFWMLYDQQSTTWVEQARKMNPEVSFIFFSFNIIPAQMQAINGILILIFIPVFTGLIYPTLRKYGYELHYLNKMCLGMLFASMSFFVAAVLEIKLLNNLNIMWQLPQYILLTIGEVLLSMTGIEYVYTQSPPNLKGLILSGWLLTVSVGNFYVIILTFINVFSWLQVSNVNVYNHLIYGMIGLIATFYFHRNLPKMPIK